MPLDTLDNIKTTLQIKTEDDDALLMALQTAADSFVETYCGRIFTGGSFTEDHPGGGRTLFLRNYPVENVIAVNVDPNRSFTSATQLPSQRYVVHADRGVIESLDGPFIADRASGNSFPQAVRVSYTTPVNEVPAAVKRAYAELVGHWYRQARTHEQTEQRNWLQRTEGGSTITQYPWGQSGGFRLPVPVQQVLDLFRTLPLAG